MSFHERRILLVFALLATIGISSGCSRKPKPAIAPAPTPPPVTETQPTTEPAKPPEAPPPVAAVELQDVFFDFDRYNLRDDARNSLNADAKALDANASVRVLLEGHCDERGTVEYNLALGQKRADAVRSYLVQYGIDPARISTISYGEERPFAEGHDEGAWWQNRRVHFVRK